MEIHPHPGPTRRGVRSRGEGRKEKEGGGGAGKGWGVGAGLPGLMALLLVVTWNVKRLSVREANGSRLRGEAKRVMQERWEMVLLTQMRVDEEWFGWGKMRREWC